MVYRRSFASIRGQKDFGFSASAKPFLDLASTSFVRLVTVLSTECSPRGGLGYP